MAVGETDSPKPSSTSTSSVDNAGDSTSGRSVTPVEANPDDLYPHGFKLVVLAAGSLVSVFLIALDQVSTPSAYDDPV